MIIDALQKRFSDPTAKWKLSDILILIGSIFVLLILIYIMIKAQLDKSDALLLNFISVVITCLVSVFIGRYFSVEEAFKRLEGEATKALRRILRIKDATINLKLNCVRIAQGIRNHFDDDEQKILLEYINGLNNQLTDLLNNVDSSIDDWGDMLPDKVRIIKESENELFRIVMKKHEELGELYNEYEKKLQQAGQDQRDLIQEELDDKAKNIKKEFDAEIAKKKMEFKFEPISVTAATSPSSPGQYFGIASNIGLVSSSNLNSYVVDPSQIAVSSSYISSRSTSSSSAPTATTGKSTSTLPSKTSSSSSGSDQKKVE
jgi:hypothetical protein